MKHWAHLAVIWSLLAFAGCATKPIETMHRTAVHLQFSDGSCSGTVVGKQTILTAEHCLDGGGDVLVDGVKVKIYNVERDGKDHALLLTDHLFPQAAVVAAEPPQGTSVYVLGNPGDLVNIYRQGYIAGYKDVHGLHVTLYDLNGFYGDSGAGIFDSEGRLVGVISVLYQQVSDGYMKVMGSFGLAFTPEQWNEALSWDETLAALMEHERQQKATNN
jgi:hypothetical protein